MKEIIINNYDKKQCLDYLVGNGLSESQATAIHCLLESVRNQFKIDITEWIETSVKNAIVLYSFNINNIDKEIKEIAKNISKILPKQSLKEGLKLIELTEEKIKKLEEKSSEMVIKAAKKLEDIYAIIEKPIFINKFKE